jgi:tetratricopeptide (TPR) repeat protein
MLSLLFWLPACSSTPKAKVRAPLAVGPGAPPAVLKLTEQGTQAHLAGRYEQAQTYFEQAVSLAPSSAEAHYNLGLSLFARGDTERAREQFIEAANLAPGDKVIWDSPALRPFGSPEGAISKKAKETPYSTQRPTFGGGPRR